ncbi:MAG TPA: HAD family hydrolase [Chloroflexota bacterium]|nr:HAD family hydrolase [Chloroflexota bacterium]
MSGARAVFLDRDGTLIRNHHYGCDPDSIEFLDGVVDGLRLLKLAGYKLVVVTNQSGVARGYFTEECLLAMHRRLGELLEREGVSIDGFYYCPHHAEGVVPQYSHVCDCRKPEPGMVLRGCEELAIDPSHSWLIGDTLDDVEAGKRAGCQAILLDVGTEGPPESPERTPDYVAKGFREAVYHILEQRYAKVGIRSPKSREKQQALARKLAEYYRG